jgi:hypothetical protein
VGERERGVWLMAVYWVNRAKDKVADGISKILEAKDEADKAVAVAQVEKLAKKLKKGKKK